MCIFMCIYIYIYTVGCCVFEYAFSLYILYIYIYIYRTIYLSFDLSMISCVVCCREEQALRWAQVLASRFLARRASGAAF